MNAIALETGAAVKATSFHALKKESELCALLTSLGSGDFLLIDHFDSIKAELLNPLCSAMEELFLDIVIGKGPSARNVRLDLPCFTLIGVTESEKDLPKKLLDCFPIIARMGEYTEEELVCLSKAFALKMQVEITDEAARRIAVQADGSYRKLTNYLKRARDFATVKNNGVIDDGIIGTIVDLG